MGNCFQQKDEKEDLPLTIKAKTIKNSGLIFSPEEAYIQELGQYRWAEKRIAYKLDKVVLKSFGNVFQKGIKQTELLDRASRGSNNAPESLKSIPSALEKENLKAKERPKMKIRSEKSSPTTIIKKKKENQGSENKIAKSLTFKDPDPLDKAPNLYGADGSKTLNTQEEQNPKPDRNAKKNAGHKHSHFKNQPSTEIQSSEQNIDRNLETVLLPNYIEDPEKSVYFKDLDVSPQDVSHLPTEINNQVNLS